MPSAPTTGARSTGELLLQQRYGTRERAQRFYDEQVLDHLNPAMRAFVARQQMMFLATSDAHGNCDNSFRAGPAGFVQTLDVRRLTWPEYRGNGVLASLGNIAENPHVGLLFVDFFDDGVGLHVNGTAMIVEDPDIRAEHPHLPVDPVFGRRTPRWVVADVHEAYIHCSKFMPRLCRPPAGDRQRHHRPASFVERPRTTPTPPQPAEPPVPAGRRPRLLRWPLHWLR